METETEAAKTGWHTVPPEAIFQEFDTCPEGLSDSDAAARLERFGPNRLPPPKRQWAIVRFLGQFNNLLIYVLVVAGTVTAAIGHMTDAAVIFGVVVINAIIGFIEEGRAEHAIESIRNLLAPHATVIRDGRRIAIPAEDLVPGDVVLIESGDRVPADLRLTQLRNLQIQEAALTGESVAVEKNVGPLGEETPLAERRSMAYSGTLVTYGRGQGIVVATGLGTEIGRISTMLGGVRRLTTPLLRQIEQFARWLTAAIISVAAATFLFGIVVRNYSLTEMFLAAVGLTVAAIPEGLPAIMTITLAIGVQRMARRNAIIRRLPAVETLGSISVICSDKTGTLTKNEMTVQALATRSAIVGVTGVGYEPAGSFVYEGEIVPPEQSPLIREIARAGLLCSDAHIREAPDGWRAEGDPMEAALVVMAVKAGIDPELERKEWPRTDLIPFESEHRFMATLNHDHWGRARIYVKGAPERILAMCTHEAGCGQTEGVRALDTTYWHECMDRLAEEGQRVLALAVKDAEAERRELVFGHVETGLTLLGLVGLADPPRPEVIDAVATCRSAGIGVKMITGDHAGTAVAIGHQLGLGAAGAIGGHELDALEQRDLEARAMNADIFARAAPEHKLRLVEALQARGQIVAMTGDGVNDAPALKRADVGIAMGLRGTEAAKEAAEMVLGDDNFASIVEAVREGRTVYDNLKKAITFILPTNGAEAGVIIAAILMGRMLPITPVQILWVNMVTAVTLALALAFESAEADIMRRRPRRPREPLLSPFLVWRIVFVSAVGVAGIFGLFIFERERGMDVETARTIAVNTLVLFEIFYMLNSRHLHSSVLSREGLFGSRPALVAIAIVLALQWVFTYTAPMQHVFESRPLDALVWLRMAAVAATVFVFVELEKALWRALMKRRRAR